MTLALVLVGVVLLALIWRNLRAPTDDIDTLIKQNSFKTSSRTKADWRVVDNKIVDEIGKRKWDAVHLAQERIAQNKSTREKVTRLRARRN